MDIRNGMILCALVAGLADGRNGRQAWKVDETRTENRIDCTYTLTSDDLWD